MIKGIKQTGILIWITLLGVQILAQSNARLTNANKPEPVKIPRGTHVLVDGKISAGEWADARRVVASDFAVIYVKRDVKYLYIALDTTTGVLGVDLYLDNRDNQSVLNLHASAKLGEREAEFGKWQDWVWWNNQGWAANVVRVDSFEPRKFLRDQSKEFQIELSRLKSQRFWLCADMYAGNESRSLPIQGSERYGRQWLELRF
ncbi:MAG: hypothetical protein AB1757_24655 [Acidobacteriota bacterium]